MTAFLYSVNGQWWVSLAPEVDVTYWRGEGFTVGGGWKYRSIGWAVCDWRRLSRGRTGQPGLRAGHVGHSGEEHGERVRLWKRRDVPITEGEYVKLGEGTDAASFQTLLAQWEEWRPLLAGRSLLLHEVRRLLAAKGTGELPLLQLQRVLQVGVLKRGVNLSSGIRMEGGQAAWKCERCHSGRGKLYRTECANCGGTCYYCDACLLLGRSRACEPLLQFTVCGERVTSNMRYAQQPHMLTPAQERAAEKALQFVKNGTEPTMLMWAVTGAGKTEMTFGVVDYVLSGGGRVAIASPRKDVVNELTPRFRDAFPQVRTVKLHGESGETWQDGELIIATTHQLLRWYRAFDLIVVDEVDAFPYRHNESLQAGIRRALTANGRQLWLTATPPRSWQIAFHRGQLPGVTIPARHHRHPLPEPVVTVERRLWKLVQAGRPVVPMSLFFTHVCRVEGQAYVFVPGLPHIAPVLNWIERQVHGMKAAGVSSRDRRRAEKVEAFRNKELHCLVTTTILERGVTVANAHVLILQADHPIFDEAALVQMSGRSGRSTSYPNGLVSWVSTENTREQRRALKHIRAMNREALERGWLNP